MTDDKSVAARLKRFSLRQMAEYLRKRMRGEAGSAILGAHGEKPIDFVRWAYHEYPRLRRKIAVAIARVLQEELMAKKEFDVVFWLLELVAEIAPRSCEPAVLNWALDNDDRLRQRLEVGFGMDVTVHSQAVNAGLCLHLEREPRFRKQLVRDLAAGENPFIAYAGLTRFRSRFAAAYFPQLIKAAMRTERAESELRKALLLVDSRWKRSRALDRIAQVVRAMETECQELFTRASARPERLRRSWEASLRTSG